MNNEQKNYVFTKCEGMKNVLHCKRPATRAEEKNCIQQAFKKLGSLGYTHTLLENQKKNLNVIMYGDFKGKKKYGTVTRVLYDIWIIFGYQSEEVMRNNIFHWKHHDPIGFIRPEHMQEVYAMQVGLNQ